MGGSISDETDQLSTPASAQVQLPNSTNLEPSNLNVQDLQTDIQKLRQKYYAQYRVGQFVPTINETTMSAPVQVSAPGTAIYSQGINSQYFQINQPNRLIQSSGLLKLLKPYNPIFKS